MRKCFILVVFVMLSGCATSSYNKGCHDALEYLYIGAYKEWQDKYCADLETKYNERQAREVGARGKQ